jgi:hypothetical protein
MRMYAFKIAIYDCIRSMRFRKSYPQMLLSLDMPESVARRIMGVTQWLFSHAGEVLMKAVKN